ncbi:MAG: hypothetical protein RIR94_878 [Bacteroidota bacterium]
MESFWRRLRYYGLGFGLGLILTFGIFNTRGCSWTPENRVKDAMNKRVWIVDMQKVNSFYKDHKLNDAKFYRLMQDADISFTKSIRSGRHKVYDITFTDGKKREAHCLARMTDESFVVEFIPGVKNIKEYRKMKSSSIGASIIHTPNQKHLVYAEDNPAIKEHLRALGIPNDIQLQKALLSGHFDYQKSRLNEQPRPVHVFQFIPQNNKRRIEVSAACIWYKDKIKVYSLSEERIHF